MKKASDYLSKLVKAFNNPAATSILINMITASTLDGPATHTCSKTKNIDSHYIPCRHSVPITRGYHQIEYTPVSHRRLLGSFTTNAKDRSILKMYLQMVAQCKTPHQEADNFTHINGLLYKHAMDVTQKFLGLIIPKSWYFKYPSKSMINWAAKVSTGLIISSNGSTTGKE